MYANQIRAGEGTLPRAAALVADAKVDFDRLAADLGHQIQAAQGRWQGAGGTAFFALHQAWTDRQRVIVAALDRFRDELVGTDTVLTGADESARAAAQAGMQRLGGIGGRA
jgi:WXG100 family type VII secretion target